MPAVALPSVTNDPINSLNLSWLRQSARGILAELVAALPDAARSRVEGIPLVVDDTPGDVNAFAACSDGHAAMAVTDGLLEIMGWLAMASAHDEAFGTQKTDEYIRFIAQNLAPGRAIPRPANFFATAQQEDGRKVQRQHVIFEEEVAFVLGHELAHHHLGHLPCTGKPGPLGSAELARVLASQVPFINQPNEAAADLAGTTNVLDAGVRRAGAHWNEEGALLTMRFFAGIDGGLAANLLLAFQQSHPPAQMRIPLIQQSANYWRRNGGVGVPVPRIGG
jgi:peptidase M48-like protein